MKSQTRKEQTFFREMQAQYFAKAKLRGSPDGNPTTSTVDIEYLTKSRNPTNRSLEQEETKEEMIRIGIRKSDSKNATFGPNCTPSTNQHANTLQINKANSEGSEISGITNSVEKHITKIVLAERREKPSALSLDKMVSRSSISTVNQMKIEEIELNSPPYSKKQDG